MPTQRACGMPCACSAPIAAQRGEHRVAVVGAAAAVELAVLDHAAPTGRGPRASRSSPAACRDDRRAAPCDRRARRAARRRSSTGVRPGRRTISTVSPRTGCARTHASREADHALDVAVRLPLRDRNAATSPGCGCTRRAAGRCRRPTGGRCVRRIRASACGIDAKNANALHDSSNSRRRCRSRRLRRMGRMAEPLRPMPGSPRIACSTRSTASACAATGACWRSTATRTASTRCGATTRRRSSRSSIGPRAGATRRSSRSTRSSPSWPSARFPWCAPLALDGATLHASTAFASPCSRGAAAARRSSTIRDTLEWHRPLHRPHPRRRRGAPFAHGPRSTSKRSATSRATSCSRTIRARRPARRLDAASSARRSTACALFRARGRRRDAAPARRLPREQRAVDRRTGRTSSISTTPHRPGGAGPVDAAVGRSRGDGAPARRRARRLRGLSRVRPARAASGRGAAHAAPDPLFARGSRGAGTIRRFRRRSRGSTRSATGRTASSNCASRSR